LTASLRYLETLTESNLALSYNRMFCFGLNLPIYGALKPSYRATLMNDIAERLADPWTAAIVHDFCAQYKEHPGNFIISRLVLYFAVLRAVLDRFGPHGPLDPADPDLQPIQEPTP
jgi:hypothetical protein